ncbi:WYL domain-containing protein [Streptomyces sp. H10-C2]|uniref:helix-turn-helix transcriptional regulator n=1 Tax=unclassified Streptomyces TaxID=2593676 RepID=UPI0024BBCD49|nr:MULTISPECIES: WYL domain-containing protein [unclassified Streptomyces]MDJ0343619.1 WYL domain-containing protein [Streptomyces sp. PH10-H1]MDJ0373133.1 WYL domain-containing protein [Streptomyces sp. H10-C2]
MRDPSGRLLQLLSLLQTPRAWPGPELAERLGVTPRTIRRDVDRLRELGYPVDALQGNIGGYRLTAGAAMPPLLLDDDEAVAIAIGLRTAATAAVTGIEDTALRAMAKLEQVLPVRLRHRVTALSRAAVVLPPGDGPAADADTLATFAAACANHEKVRFGYTTAQGGMTRRLVEPHQLVVSGRRWYLVAFDGHRAGWRSFRVDRITGVHRTGVRVPARVLPEGVDTATWVTRAMAAGTIRARLLLHVPLEQAAQHIAAGQGDLEPVDNGSCLLHTRPDSPQYLASRIVLLPMDYTLLDPPELAEHLGAIAARARHAIRPFTEKGSRA